MLVVGLEDIGIPYEIFHANRSRPGFQKHILWKASGGSPPITMRDFLVDPRLQRLYTQNYDLLGCTAFYCSDVTLADSNIIKKVIPIPIGLDLHSVSIKKYFHIYRTSTSIIIGNEVFPDPTNHIFSSSIPTSSLSTSIHNFLYQDKSTVCKQRIFLEQLLLQHTTFPHKSLRIIAPFSCSFRGSEQV